MGFVAWSMNVFLPPTICSQPGVEVFLFRRPPPPPLSFIGTHGDGLRGEVGHTSCNVCFVAMWLGHRAKSCGVLAAPCTYGDPEPVLAAPPLQGGTQNL